DTRNTARAAIGVLARAAICACHFTFAGSGRSGQRLPDTTGFTMTVERSMSVMWCCGSIPMLASMFVGCAGSDDTSRGKAAAAAGPASVDVVRVVEQPLDVQLSLPGELTPYQTVAL